MREQNIQRVREACIKANPEIAELKFGCCVKVKNKSFPSGYTTVISGLESAHGIRRGEAGRYITSNFGPIEDGTYEVLGRPIRLADVLLAIMKVKDGCMQSELKNILLKLAYLWNCFADDLTEQSDECLQFLADLLS